MSLLMASNFKLVLAEKKKKRKCIGSHGWIVGSRDWEGFRHDWNKFPNNIVMSVSLSLFLSLSLSLQLSTLGDFIFSAGSFTWWASWPLETLDSHLPILATLAGRGTPVSYKHTSLQAQGRPLLRLRLGHAFIFEPIVMAAVRLPCDMCTSCARDNIDSNHTKQGRNS